MNSSRFNPSRASLDASVVGFSLVVIATLPKLVAAAKRALVNDVPTSLLSRVVVVDALQLLEALRTGASS